jgi:hypothetical protein
MERIKENGNLFRGSIKRVENLNQSSTYQLLKKEYTWSDHLMPGLNFL